MIVKKCPHCGNNIRLHPVKFPFVNDKGGVIIECDNCHLLSYCEITNPIESSISKGGKKISIWDSDVSSVEDSISDYDNIKELKSGLLLIGDLEHREYKFSFSSPHIYFCVDCENEVESKSREALEHNFQDLSKIYNTFINYVLANHRHEHDNLIIEVKAKCSCGKDFTSYWHKKFIADNKKLDIENDLFLIGTDMPAKRILIDGIMSKNECKSILEKFIIRWNAIYPRLLIVTPFIGHQWLSPEEIIELWEWIKNFLDPEKSTLVTRTATLNKYKKASHENGISIELLESYGLNNSIIQELTRKQDFHAKIYVGYSMGTCEILMGSFNLMDGPSVENISFKSTGYDSFIKKFISPMNITITPPGDIESIWFRICKDEKNEWSAGEIRSSDILNSLMTYD